ncbi:ComEA family DNA-binding protein [Aerococcaceae bacterium NML171108]|nr:ComEA family DNA-binding protein [Aerococcaceae bacterium NML171108]
MQKIIEQYKLIIIGALGSIVLLFLVWRSIAVKQQPFVMLSSVESEVSSFSLEESSDSSEEKAPDIIYVDIKGAVKQPNVYALPSGSRLFDLIELAGGFLPEAETSVVNQAQLLNDQMLIYIHTQDEWAESGQVIIMPTHSDTTNEGFGLVNLNTANVSELQTLPGIGASKAEAIVAYRTENGSFQSIEELQQVKGIGGKTYEQLAPLITVGH